MSDDWEDFPGEGPRIQKHTRKRGLSTGAIIAIVTVVVILVIPFFIGLIAGVTLPVIGETMKQAEANAVVARLRSLSVLVEGHREKHGELPASWEELRNPSGEPGGEIPDFTDAMFESRASEQPYLLVVEGERARIGWLGWDGIEGGDGFDADIWVEVPASRTRVPVRSN